MDHGVPQATSLALGPRDQIIVGATLNDSASYNQREQPHFLLARYDEKGVRDKSFGRGGVAIGRFGRLSAIAVLRDGKILAAGYGRGALLEQFTADGSPDASFGHDGLASLRGEGITDVCLAVQRDGEILLGALVDLWPRDAFTLLLARFKADGSLDGDFGIDGAVSTSTPAGPLGVPQGLHVARDGSIRLEFLQDGGDSQTLLSVVQMDSSGGNRMVFSRSVPGSVGSTVDDGAGGFLALGFKYSGAMWRSIPGSVTRLRADGSPVADFGADGQTTVPIDGWWGLGGFGTGVALPDGSFLVAGTYSATLEHIMAVHILPTGNVDTSFGRHGLMLTQPTGPDNSHNSLAMVASERNRAGQVIVAGGAVVAGGPANYLVLARYGLTAQYTPAAVPTASLVRFRPPESQSKRWTVQVAYSSATPLDLGSVSAANVVLHDELSTYDCSRAVVKRVSRSTWTIAYTFDSGAVPWSEEPDDIYWVELLSGQIRDVQGHYAIGGDLAIMPVYQQPK